MAEPLPVAFDLTRLLSRARYATPTGIDRVDLAWAEALLEADDLDLRFLSFRALDSRQFDRAAGHRLIERIAARWRAQPREETPAYAALRAWLAAPAGTPRPTVRAAPEANDWLAAARGAIRLAWPPPASRVPPLYVNTSHGRLYQPRVQRWLARHSGGGVYFVHDLIPIEYPEHNRAGEDRRHEERLRLIAREARCAAVNSQATANALAAWLAGAGLPQPPVAVLPLGVAEAFLHHAAPPAAALPYFVAIGTIEPRKNHALLLRLWRQMASVPGAATPRLVVIGRRGWNNEAVFAQLDHDSALEPLVVEAAGLADAEIASLLRGARALLAPSFAEGYGLPVAEALAVGTPVLASDLPAHREVAGDFAEYLDPRADDDWLAAIRAYAATGSDRQHARQAATAGFHPTRWRTHGAAAVAAIRRATVGPAR